MAESRLLKLVRVARRLVTATRSSLRERALIRAQRREMPVRHEVVTEPADRKRRKGHGAGAPAETSAIQAPPRPTRRKRARATTTGSIAGEPAAKQRQSGRIRGRTDHGVEQEPALPPQPPSLLDSAEKATRRKPRRAEAAEPKRGGKMAAREATPGSESKGATARKRGELEGGGISSQRKRRDAHAGETKPQQVRSDADKRATRKTR